MAKKINRRRFISKTSKLGAAALAGSLTLTGKSSFASLFTLPDIVVINGTNYFQNTIQAIEALGGMGKFVPKGSKVGILINSDFDVPGAYVNPDISIAAVKMIFDAGASEITKLQVIKPEYWQRSSHFEEFKDMLDSLKVVSSNTFPAEYNEADFVKISPIEGGKSLKETEVVKSWLDCDVFINIPIAKHHATTFLTGALKNIMGVSTRKANVTFHLGSGIKNDPEYLAQCIVDQNLLKKTNLCIMDATEFITNNGPSGPGDIRTEHKIVVGTDIVAIDSLCSQYVGYEHDEILTSVLGNQAGLGTLEFSKLNILELTA
jgi:uncharacterized protein (DUF362 family)